MRTIAKRPARRWLLPLFAGALITMLASQSVLAAVSWTRHIKAGPAKSWNIGGRGLATTTSEFAILLHEQFQDDRRDPVGVYYRRAGGSWGLIGGMRINPADEPGEYGAIAAAGTSVYVAYLASDHDANNYDPDAPRQVRVRVHTNHGSSMTPGLANKTINATGRGGLPGRRRRRRLWVRRVHRCGQRRHRGCVEHRREHRRRRLGHADGRGHHGHGSGRRGWQRRRSGDRRGGITRVGRVDRRRRRHAHGEDLDRSRRHVARHGIHALERRCVRSVRGGPR